MLLSVTWHINIYGNAMNKDVYKNIKLYKMYKIIYRIFFSSSLNLLSAATKCGFAN